MSNVVRLVNGGTIQVRTGVLQGIGPQGPRGIAGPAGPQGDQGPQGLTGPQGAITQVGTKTLVASSQALTANTDTLVAFATVVYDDGSMATSSTNYTAADVGDYLVTVGVAFSDPGSATGARKLKINSVTNGDLIIDQRNAIVGDITYATVSFVHRTTVGNEVLRIYARTTQVCNISSGSLVISRVGSGPAGAQGPAGPTGPIGPIGLTGPQGPAGNASSGFTHYSDLL